MNTETLTFDLDLQEKPVTIGGEEYVLVELDGKERDKYLNGVSARLRTAPNGQPSGVKNFDGLQASLIAASLRKVVDGVRMPVDIKVIQSWPSRVLEGLHNACKELSALGTEEGEQGND